MHLTVLTGSDLTPSLTARWRFLQQSNPTLASPFFSPEFFLAVSRARDDVRVALIEENGEVAAFFPFQRHRFGLGGPVGGPLSDYHGLVALPGRAWDARELIAGCGLQAWDFNHLPALQCSFTSFARRHVSSPVMNLPDGYEPYVRERKERGTKQIDQCARKLRKLEREVGSVRFDAHVADAGVLRELMDWKARQYRHTGGIDLFRQEWVQQTLTDIHSTQVDTFGGMLSALYADGRLVAIHFGMRSASVWHYWFPTYLPAFGKYSVGMILLLKMAETAASIGLRCIDLGKGDQRYKQQLMNDTKPLAEGWVTLHDPISRVHGWSRQLESFLRGSGCIYRPVRWGVRKWRARVQR